FLNDVETYLHERIDEVLTGSTHPILVNIFGPDAQVLRSKAEEVREALAPIHGLVDVHKEFQIDVPHVQVKENLAREERYGLKPGDVRRMAATFLAGIEVSDVHRDNKVYDLWMWSTPESRRSPQDVRNLPMDTPRGGRVPLAEVADVSIQPMPNIINRENRSRRITVEADVSGRDLGAVAREIERALGRIQFPLEYHAELAGEHAERPAAQQSRLRPILMTMAATALALVPLVVAGDIPGHEIEYPMAIVILGGLVTSTLLNLFVVPAMYLRLGRDRSAFSGPVAGAAH